MDKCVWCVWCEVQGPHCPLKPCLTCYPSRKPHSARSWLTQCPRWRSHCPLNSHVWPNYRQILINEMFSMKYFLTKDQSDDLGFPRVWHMKILERVRPCWLNDKTGLDGVVYLTCPSSQWDRVTGRSPPWCWSGKCPHSWGCSLLFKPHITVLSPGFGLTYTGTYEAAYWVGKF